MPPLFKLSPDHTLRMVKEYKKHELLYNKNHKLYKDTTARRVALKSIGDVLQLNKSVNEINRKLKSLRSTFILEQNKILVNKEYIPKLIWYNEMASFIPFTPAGNSKCNNAQPINAERHVGTELASAENESPVDTDQTGDINKEKENRSNPVEAERRHRLGLVSNGVPKSTGAAKMVSQTDRKRKTPIGIQAQSCDEVSQGSVAVQATSEVEEIESQRNKKTVRPIKTRTQAERRQRLGLVSNGVPKSTGAAKMVSQTDRKRKTPIGIQLEGPNEAEPGSVVEFSSDEEEVFIDPASNKKRSRSIENGSSESCGTSTSLAVKTQSQRPSSHGYRAIGNEPNPASQEQSQTIEALHEDEILIAFGKFINLTLRKLDMDSFLDTKTLVQKMLKEYRAYFLQEMSDSSNDETDDPGQSKFKNRSLLQQAAKNKPKVSFKVLVNDDDEYDAFTYEIVHQLRMIPGYLYFHAQSRIMTQIVAGRLPSISSDEEENAAEDESTLKERSIPQEQSNPPQEVILDEDRTALGETPLPQILSVERIIPQEQGIPQKRGIFDEEYTPFGETLLPEILSVERIIPQEEGKFQEQGNPQKRGIFDEEWTILGKQLVQEVSSQERIIHLEQRNPQDQGIPGDEGTILGKSLSQEGITNREQRNAQERGILYEEGTILGKKVFQGVSSQVRLIHQEQSYPQKRGILGEKGSILEKSHHEVSSQERIIHREQRNLQERGILYEEGTILGKQLVQEVFSQERIIYREQRNPQQQGILGEESTTPCDALTGKLSNIIGSLNIDADAALQDLLYDVTSPSKRLFRDLDNLEMETS